MFDITNATNRYLWITEVRPVGRQGGLFLEGFLTYLASGIRMVFLTHNRQTLSWCPSLGGSSKKEQPPLVLIPYYSSTNSPSISFASFIHIHRETREVRFANISSHSKSHHVHSSQKTIPFSYNSLSCLDSIQFCLSHYFSTIDSFSFILLTNDETRASSYW